MSGAADAERQHNHASEAPGSALHAALRACRDTVGDVVVAARGAVAWSLGAALTGLLALGGGGERVEREAHGGGGGRALAEVVHSVERLPGTFVSLWRTVAGGAVSLVESIVGNSKMHLAQLALWAHARSAGRGSGRHSCSIAATM